MTSSSPSSSQMTIRSSSLVMSSLAARWEREAREGNSGGRPLVAKLPPSPGAAKDPGAPYWGDGFGPENEVGPETICGTDGREEFRWVCCPMQPSLSHLPGDLSLKPGSVLAVLGCLLPHHQDCVLHCGRRLWVGLSQVPQLHVAVLLHRGHSLEPWCPSSRASGQQRTGAQKTPQGQQQFPSPTCSVPASPCALLPDPGSQAWPLSWTSFGPCCTTSNLGGP